MSPVRTGQNGELSCGRFNAPRCGMDFGESANRIEEPGAIGTAAPDTRPWVQRGGRRRVIGRSLRLSVIGVTSHNSTI